MGLECDRRIEYELRKNTGREREMMGRDERSETKYDELQFELEYEFQFQIQIQLQLQLSCNVFRILRFIVLIWSWSGLV